MMMPPNQGLESTGGSLFNQIAFGSRRRLPPVAHVYP